MNYAWVLGNYVSALEAVGSREWKKSATRISTNMKQLFSRMWLKIFKDKPDS